MLAAWKFLEPAELVWLLVAVTVPIEGSTAGATPVAVQKSPKGALSS
jgi:hypothetical protein